MAKLFQELKIKNLILKNRIIVSPMCQYSAQAGVATDWHLVHLGGFAKGGAAMVIVEATAVEDIGRISPACLVLENQKQMQALKPICKFIKTQNCIPAIQIGHAGRKAHWQMPWDTNLDLTTYKQELESVGPSAIAFSDSYMTPKELSISEIQKIIEKFVHSAQLAVEAGFEVIELHMAHGYLMHQFLSPISNKRSDNYGGSLENRMSLPLQVLAAVKQSIPDTMPLFVRISATDWAEDGMESWDLKQSIVFAKELKKLGADLVDVSTGGTLASAKIPVKDMYQVEFARAIKQEVGILTSAVGMIQNANQAEQILQEESADAIMIARGMLRNPNWAVDAALELKVKAPIAKQYTRAY